MKVLFFCLFVPTLLLAQWLATTIYLPDSLSGITNPISFAENVTNNKIYVGGAIGNSIIVIDGITNNKIAKIPVELTNYGSPTALVYTPINNKIYCVNYSSNNVSIIDGLTNQVVTTISVGEQPIAFAYNPLTNSMYVANYYGSSISVICDMMPGMEEVKSSILAGTRIRLFPDPAKTFFVVCCPWAVNKVTIYDVSGKMVKEIALPRNDQTVRVSLAGINKGVYFIKVGNTIIKEKLVVVK